MLAVGTLVGVVSFVGVVYMPQMWAPKALALALWLLAVVAVLLMGEMWLVWITDGADCPTYAEKEEG